MMNPCLLDVSNLAGALVVLGGGGLIAGFTLAAVLVRTTPIEPMLEVERDRLARILEARAANCRRHELAADARGASRDGLSAYIARMQWEDAAAVVRGSSTDG